MGHLVDMKDLYQALAEVKSDILPKESRTYLAYKIREACRVMRETAKHVEERIDLFDPPPPKRKRRKATPARRSASRAS